MKYIFISLFTILFTACSFNQPQVSKSATILIKTPSMKYYDRGFISKYMNYTKVQIYSAGQTVLDLQIYEDRVCKSTFQCQSLKEFNKEFLHSSYNESFIKSIFDSSEQNIVHRDKSHNILIKIQKD